MKVLHAKLCARRAAIIVLHYTVADIHWVSGLDVVEVSRHVECDCRYMMIWMGLLDKFELEVSSLRSNLADASVVIYVVCAEDRHAVARSERLELL